MKQVKQKLLAMAQRASNTYLRAGVAVSCLLLPGLSFADTPTIGGDDIGQVAQKATTEGSSVVTFLWTAAQVIGIGLAIKGLSMWHKASAHEDGRHSHGKAFFVTLIGCAMFFLPVAMGVGASSLFAA